MFELVPKMVQPRGCVRTRASGPARSPRRAELGNVGREKQPRVRMNRVSAMTAD